MSDWDPIKGTVDLDLLEIDASREPSKDCAKSIQASMNKLKAEDNDPTNLLYGNAMDSGGGDVLDSLADKL